jgi:hypothetical protein
MDLESKEIKQIVESVLNEMFDDFTQMDKYYSYDNPYNADHHKLVDVDRFANKQLSRGTKMTDIHDIRHKFAIEILPTLNKIPNLMRMARLDDTKEDRVVLILRFKIKRAELQMLFHFFIRNKNLIIKTEPRFYYNKNKLTPEQEQAIDDVSDVVDVISTGDHLKVIYKPLTHLQSRGEYTAPVEDKGKLIQFFYSMLGGIQQVGNQLQRTELP